MKSYNNYDTNLNVKIQKIIFGVVIRKKNVDWF